MTRKLKEAVRNYGLKLVHTGSLSHVPNNPYLIAEMISGADVEKMVDSSKEAFFFRFNHFEPQEIVWTVWESKYFPKEKAFKINDKYRNAKGRMLWSSFQLYFRYGSKLYIVI